MPTCNLLPYHFRNETDSEGHSGPTFTTCIILSKLNGAFDSILSSAVFVESRLFPRCLESHSCWLMAVIHSHFLECILSRKDDLRTFIPGGWDREWSFVRDVLQMSEFGEYLSCYSVPFSQHKPQILNSVAIHYVLRGCLPWTRHSAECRRFVAQQLSLHPRFKECTFWKLTVKRSQRRGSYNTAESQAAQLPAPIVFICSSWLCFPFSPPCSTPRRPVCKYCLRDVLSLWLHVVHGDHQ